MASRRNAFLILMTAIASIGVASCQAVPQSIADTQKPPSAALRREIMKLMQGYDGPKTEFAQISSVVVWDAGRNIKAFCLRTRAETSQQLSYASVSMINDKFDDLIRNDNRCRDKRLRYYDFPEFRNLNR